MQDFETFFQKFQEGNLSPLNRRRKILLERQYSLPNSGDTAIMDLYALYTLWWEMGAGKEAAGYQQDNIVNYKRSEGVNRYFEECLAVVSNVLLRESKEAIADEAENVFDPYLLPSKRVFAWVQENDLMQNFHKAYNDKQWWKHFTYGQTMDMFNADFWEEADMYGGEKWAGITNAVRTLDAAIRRGKDKDLMYAVDKLLDIEHNTGSLSSKLTKMKVDKNTLDLRAGFRSVQEFKPYVSSQVAQLIRD
jgi:hypothetical protein